MLYASGSFMMSIISLPGTLGIAIRSFVSFSHSDTNESGLPKPTSPTLSALPELWKSTVAGVEWRGGWGWVGGWGGVGMEKVVSFFVSREETFFFHLFLLSRPCLSL